MSQNKSEFVFDGDGRPVIEKRGQRGFSITSPPSGTLTTAVTGYQVWSTVLVAGLTSINPDGTTGGSSVFAGGAVIAKTGPGGARWSTADPVTGTVGTFLGDGTASAEESEPLGQTIHPHDPAELPDPLPNQTFFGSADDPEWQCQVPENFLPISCKIKAEIYDATHGTGIYTIYDPNKKPGDPTFIHAGNTPVAPETKEERKDEELIHQATHSSEKPKDMSYGGTPVQPASVPNASGENDGDVDLDNRIVTVRGGPSLPFDFQDASVSGSITSGSTRMLVGDDCDIRDLNMPDGVSIARNVKTAERRYYVAVGASVAGAVIAPIGLGLTAVAVENHAGWFINQVDTGKPWDYKALDKVGNPTTGKSIYEPFGNFHYGVVGAAAGFNRGKTLQRMAGYIQERNKEKSDGGEHGGLKSIIQDFLVAGNGPKPVEYPYKDEIGDQLQIERGIAYYNAGCHKK